MIFSAWLFLCGHCAPFIISFRWATISRGNSITPVYYCMSATHCDDKEEWYVVICLVFPMRLFVGCIHENSLLKAFGTLWQNIQCCIFPLADQCSYNRDISTVAGKRIVQENIPVNLEISKSPGSGRGLLVC